MMDNAKMTPVDGGSIEQLPPDEAISCALADPSIAIHWYDLTCPFCYIAQTRNAQLEQLGFKVVELPLQAHPDIPAAGLTMEQRSGTMYTNIEQEAKKANLPINWPPRLPNSRLALASAEWVRRNAVSEFKQFQKSLFDAHLVLGQDIGAIETVERHARVSSIDVELLRDALRGNSPFYYVSASENEGKNHGIRGTPAWLVNGHLVSGLIEASQLQKLVANAS